MTRDEKFMRSALELARQALSLGEVPVGAVVVLGERIIGSGFNSRETDKNSLCHAEIKAINDACKNLNGWRLNNCELFVTLEPCPMCAGAVINSRIKRVIYGASDKKAGSCGSVTDLFALPYNHKPQTVRGVLENECSDILSEFFSQLRLSAVQAGSENGIFFFAEGTLWNDSPQHYMYPGIKELLQKLHENYRILVVSIMSSEELDDIIKAHGLDIYIDCRRSYGMSEGLAKTDVLRMLIKRSRLKRAFCTGSADTDRQAAQTCGLPFVYAAYSSGKVRSCDAAITSPAELLQKITLL